MADRERILEYLSRYLLAYGSSLNVIPIETWVLKDALELLKAQQEPRLYSFDEVLHLPADTTLWLEEVDEPDGAIIPTAYTGASFRGDPAEISDSDVIYVCFYGRVMNTCDGYNRYWRCWTAKPTDEQRKAVSWDG